MTARDELHDKMKLRRDADEKKNRIEEIFLKLGIGMICDNLLKVGLRTTDF